MFRRTYPCQYQLKKRSHSPNLNQHLLPLLCLPLIFPHLFRKSPTSIPPRPVFNPAIINASKAMFSKHPSQLEPVEILKFNYYRNNKRGAVGVRNNLPAKWRNTDLPTLQRTNITAYTSSCWVFSKK